MVNNIRPVYPERNLLLKYADDLTLSLPDHSFIEVNTIQHWAVRNRMKLNLTKTWEMVVHGRTVPNHCHLGYRELNEKAG